MQKSFLPIQSPDQLNSFSMAQLEQLAAQVRKCIVNTMAINGGHLGSNMGAVELTIALHKVFSSPKDRFIFDVSHQTYTHKLLTGRYEKFGSIRKFNGLSGFSHPKESIHDHFFAGHAATALSLGLGTAKVRDLDEDQFHVIPVIGDATFTCGLAMEALNNLPQNLTNFLCILNDNNMSISDNVGAIPTILGKEAKPFFNQYGMDYIGPIDGHNLPLLIETLEVLKQIHRPTLLHVHTIKGKGLPAAELDPIAWHGCSPFDKVTAKKAPSGQLKFPKVFGEHLLKMAEKDPSIIVTTPAMPLGSGITPLMKAYPDRCIDVGIAEGHCVTYSGAMGKDPSKKVVCCIYATFLQRAFDNLFQDVCLQESPVVFALDRAGLATGDGCTHHGIYDIAFLNTMPNMVICQPRNGHLLKELLESSFAWKKPTAIRYPNLPTTSTDEPLKLRFLGKGEILSKGTDIAILSLGHHIQTSTQVATLLEEYNLSTTLADPIFLKPLDQDLLFSLFENHKLIITIEEHALSSGLGNLINHFAMQNNLNTPVQNFGIPDGFYDQGSHKELLQSIELDPVSIASKILNHPLVQIPSPSVCV